MCQSVSEWSGVKNEKQKVGGLVQLFCCTGACLLTAGHSLVHAWHVCVWLCAVYRWNVCVRILIKKMFMYQDRRSCHIKSIGWNIFLLMKKHCFVIFFSAYAPPPLIPPVLFRKFTNWKKWSLFVRYHLRLGSNGKHKNPTGMLAGWLAGWWGGMAFKINWKS